MPALRPFCALRYDAERVGDLSRVLAPPYDVIDREEQERLYEASPYNVVRLILGKQDPRDTEEDNRYTRARRDFDGWRAQGLLHLDETPAVYLIEHTFQDAGGARARLGFLALLNLDDAIERIAYRHEATLSAPKTDRAKLLEALPANLEPIFCIYPDAAAAVQTMLLEQARRTPPAVRAGFGKSDEVRLWALTEPQVIEEIARRLAAATMLIADGHHRFEVAYANRTRYGTVMAYCVSMEDPALVVRPIYRIAPRGIRLDLETLARCCSVERAADPGAVMAWLAAQRSEGCFGVSDGRACYRVQVTPEGLAHWLMTPPVPLPLAALDVSLLHGLIFPSLGLDGTGITYTGELAQALRLVEEGQGSAAWLLRGIALPQVYALAAQGLILPPKTTYFYPKVPSGLAINPLKPLLTS